MEDYRYDDTYSSQNANTPAISVESASSDKADSADSTPAPPTDVPALVADQPYWWCFEGQYQVNVDAKVPTTRGS